MGAALGRAVVVACLLPVVIVAAPFRCAHATYVNRHSARRLYERALSFALIGVGVTMRARSLSAYDAALARMRREPTRFVLDDSDPQCVKAYTTLDFGANNDVTNSELLVDANVEVVLYVLGPPSSASPEDAAQDYELDLNDERDLDNQNLVGATAFRKRELIVEHRRRIRPS